MFPGYIQRNKLKIVKTGFCTRLVHVNILSSYYSFGFQTMGSTWGRNATRCQRWLKEVALDSVI